MVANLIEFVSNHYVLVGIFLVLLALLAITEARKGGKSLSNRELTGLVNRDEGVVLDVRAKKEFDAGHIVDSLNIPYEKLVSRLGELEKHKGKTIVVTVYDTCGDSDCDGCCTENRGSADQLIDIESHTNARWGVSDGMIEWADLGPTQSGGCN